MGTLSRPLVVLAVLWAVLAEAQDRTNTDELTEQFAKKLQDAVLNPQSFETNGFRVQSSLAKELGADLKPTGKEFSYLDVTADGIFRVAVESGRDGMSRGGGAAVYQRATSQPMLSAADRDGDGRIDVLEYYVVDEKGEPVMSVVDYEADGQWDMRIHYKEHYFEIWYGDRWYRVEKRGDRPGIVVAGAFVALEKSDNRWVVPRAVGP